MLLCRYPILHTHTVPIIYTHKISGAVARVNLTIKCSIFPSYKTSSQYFLLLESFGFFAWQSEDMFVRWAGLSKLSTAVIESMFLCGTVFNLCSSLHLFLADLLNVISHCQSIVLLQVHMLPNVGKSPKVSTDYYPGCCTRCLCKGRVVKYKFDDSSRDSTSLFWREIWNV